MEPATAREAVNSSGGVTVVGSDATSDFHLAPRSGNPNPSPGSAQLQSAAQPQAPANAAAPAMPVKKKRGRPRKYGPDGSAKPLSPKPISSAAPPPVIDFSSGKRQKVKPATSVSKTTKYEMENIGEWVACSVGANFTPHIFTVNSGEDVTMKIISFSQQGPRAICVLSANGVISSVMLRQPDSSGGTLTYEVSAIVFPTDPFTVEFTLLAALGRFEILSLSGSFMPNENGGSRSRTGGMSVSLASPDGRVVGGGVAGLLVAASPVQVVIGSFLAGNQHEQKPKKQKQDFISTATPTPAIPISSADPRSNPSPSPFQGDNWSSLPSDSRNKPTDINASVPGILT